MRAGAHVESVQRSTASCPRRPCVAPETVDLLWMGPRQNGRAGGGRERRAQRVSGPGRVGVFWRLRQVMAGLWDGADGERESRGGASSMALMRC